jgi:hypothetical protein
MHTSTRVVPAAIGALALAVALTGCSGISMSKKGRSGSGSHSDAGGSETSDSKTTFRLGEASPPQKSKLTESKDSTYTVTPTKVETGTKADLDKSGLKKEEDEGPQIPVYVWSTVTHKSGKALKVGDMDDDLIIKTDKNKRTKALIVIVGEAKWPNCPATDTQKQLSSGQSEKVCSAFLIPEDQKPTAVELSQGFTSKPLEWPLNG